MAGFELRANSGSLFANKRRRDGKDDPHAQGQLKLGRELIEELYHAGGDQVIWCSVWTKEPKEAGKQRWQSVYVRRPQSSFEGLVEGQPAAGQGSDFDDDIPF